MGADDGGDFGMTHRGGIMERSYAIIVFGVDVGAFGDEKLDDRLVAAVSCEMEGREGVPAFGVNEFGILCDEGFDFAEFAFLCGDENLIA